MFLVDSEVALTRVAMDANRSLQGGAGIHAEGGSLALASASVSGNGAAAGYGGGIETDGTALTLRNTRIGDNRAGSLGGGLSASGAAGTIENCQFDGNAAALAGGLLLASEGGLRLRNCIVTGNQGGGLLAGGTGLDADYNDVWGNPGGDYVSTAPGPHDLCLDPLFVGAASEDPGLGEHSPCIDRGQDDPACLDPDGSRADVGLRGGPAAEFPAPAAVADAGLGDLGAGRYLLTWTPNGEPDLHHYVVYCDSAAVFTPSADKVLATCLQPAVACTVQAILPRGYFVMAAVDTQGYAGGYSQRLPFDASGLSAADGAQAPARPAITAVTPNPFNPRVAIDYQASRTGRLDLSVYDVRGRLVRRLVQGVVAAGPQRAIWDGRDGFGREAAGGVYFARIDDGAAVHTAKMVLAR